MATAAVVPVPRGASPGIQGGHTSVPDVVSKVVSSVKVERPSISPADVVYVSRASTLLSRVEQQLKETPAAGLNQILNSAASDILAQAQTENDPQQAKVLENLATRLQVAASSGSSALPPYSLASLLGG